MWIPLMDYAMKNGVSLSTLRRHIKANKIEYRVEKGRYLLRDDSAPPAVYPVASSDTHPLHLRLQRLESELQIAHEEIAELKTLIALYEEQITPGKLDH